VTIQLPDGLDPDTEFGVEWERDDESTTITVELAGVTILVDVKHESAELAPWVIAALPQIMEAAWAAIEQEDQ
jgi:hypothetical protein